MIISIKKKIIALSCHIFVPLLLLMSSVASLHAQNLYVNDVSVWHSKDSLYCNDVDLNFHTTISYFSIPVSGYLTHNMYVYDTAYTDRKGTEDNTATCKLAAPTNPVTSTGVIKSVSFPVPPSGYTNSLVRNSVITGYGTGGNASNFTGSLNLSMRKTSADMGIAACRQSGQATRTYSSFSADTLNSDFETGGDAAWRVVSNQLVSGDIGDNQYSELATRRYFPNGGTVRFIYSVSCENDGHKYDKLMFYIDGELKATYS